MSWLDQQNPTRGSRMDKAVTYIQNRRSYLSTYLEDGRCSFSNNLSENAIRPFTVGRKNWLFCDTPNGAQASAIVYTMVEMAKANGLNVYRYLEYLLEHPDRTTAIGKRDYAMMVLAAQSGLRACDVVRLELGSIDWRAREIRLVQHKTGEPLSLPLQAESGNAIADYILNGRPDSALPNIFLCHTGVIRPLDARSASGVVSKHMKLAGIPAKRRAFHALRRTFGTRLLQNEVSFELIQQLLGHRDMDSMKLYLSIDEQGLKQCALPLLSHRKAGG